MQFTSPTLEDSDYLFIARTYQILFAALAGVLGFGFVSYHWLPDSWKVPVSSADGAIWLLCGWFGWRRPVAVVFPVFAIINGLSFGLVAHAYPDVFLFAAVLTLVAFGGLTIYVRITRQDFSFLRSFLAVSFFVLVIGSLIVPFSNRRFDHVGFAAFGTLVFLCWILYDTSQIMERTDTNLTPGVAAFELLLDIIGLNSWMADLLRSTLGRSSDE